MRLTKEQIEFIKAHEKDDAGKLALTYSGGGRKGDCTLKGEELRFALMQIEARQRLKDKLPTILENREFVFPTRISTEQSSSEVTAKLKEELVRRLTTKNEGIISADLTGGLGIDTIFMGRASERHHYVEMNPEHSTAAEVNLPLFMDNAIVHNTDAESFIRETNEKFDFVYADPARRSESNSKVFMLEDCTPNILELKPLIMNKSQWLIVKLSPMLDVNQAAEKLGAEKIIVVSVNDECKELIVVCGHNVIDECEVEAVEIRRLAISDKRLGMKVEGFKISDEGLAMSDDGLYGIPEAGMLMYEPYSAMMKVGAFKQLAVRYGMKMIAPSSHLYYTETKNSFPGREFIIKEVSTFTKNSIKTIKKANITVRNFPMSVAEVRKRFGIQDGGDIYLFLTTDIQGNKIIIHCSKTC